MNKNKTAFTFVELMVVVTILTILLTIAFISIQDYSKSSRNSVRITDIGQIKQSLGIFEVETGKYPLPGTFMEVRYLGGLLWYQGKFDNQPFDNLNNLSKKAIDPLFDNEYDFSVINNKTKYQLGALLEGNMFSTNFIFNQANAISEDDVNSYVTGDYDLFDINSQSGSNCYLITSPSLFVNNYSSTGALLTGGEYSFVYDGSNNFTQNYSTKIDNITGFSTFKIEESISKCSIDSLDELNLYISKLALAYQQLNGNNDFHEIIYNFNSGSFKQGMIDNLRVNGIKVNPDVLTALKNPSAGNIFNDTFTGINNTEIVNGYIPDSFGSWTKTGLLINGSYIVSGNELLKNDNLVGAIYPIPILPITSRDKTILLNIKNFAGGSIFVYTNYIDENNYYGVELKSSGYNIVNVVGGIQATPYPIISSEIIPLDSLIEFNITSNNIKLVINSIEKENILDALTDLSGSPAINITNNGGLIDNFILIYK
ncbi:MAG: prepilin-type N-terminal cleavage/methylation domain-containing protein [Candidatus Gracilibacteria bacterium]